MIRAVLADDHAIVRSGFTLVLERTGDIEVVGTAADGTEAYRAVASYKPDILIMDISMPPGQSGLIACERIVRDFPLTRIIILTMFEDPEYLFYTLRGGASGYILKSATSEELVSAVHAVFEGGTYIYPKMAASLTRKLTGAAGVTDADPYQVLSNRELEILTYMAKGYTNKEIAEMLCLSVKTIETHRSKIFEKLNLKSRSEMVSFAIKNKLLQL